MDFARLLGYPLSILGIVLYSPPLEKWLSTIYGKAGSLSGLVVFAVGWALLFSYLVYNLGMNVQRSRE